MNPPVKDDINRTFHIYNCSCHGDLQLLQNFLRQNHLDVDQRNAHGKSALHVAVEYDNPTAVKILIAAGADVNMTLSESPGVTPVMVAAENGHVDCLKALTAAGAEVNLSSHTGETPLKLAFEFGNMEGVKCLLRAGAKVNQDTVTADDSSPLLLALRYEDAEFVRALLQAGAKANIRDKDGKTALMYAASTKSADCCQLLLSHKADVNAKDNNDRTALMYVVKKPCMEVLLSSGADIEAQDNTGWTALVHSLENTNSISTAISNVTTLLEHGADPVVDPCHHSVFQMVNKIWRLSNFPPDNFTLESAIAHGRRQLTRLVVCNGIVPQFPETSYGLKHYKSPIGCALHFNSDDVVKYFIANCYLTNTDVEEIHLALLRVALSRADRGVPIRVHFEDDKELSEDMGSLLHRAMCEPWPLVKLAFITVSSALGCSPERRERVARTRLPVRLQRMLMFQEPVAQLPVSEWSNIPLCFDPVEYENQPRPRPLLYYWPFGRTLVV